VVTNDKCVQQFNWSGQLITANMICAGDADGGESTCKGDSGGPLVVPKSSTDDTAVVIGATSFGPGDGCGAKGWPAVYAYVTRYIDWIKPKMES
jgi:secreted trypsin-like serine protease